MKDCKEYKETRKQQLFWKQETKLSTAIALKLKEGDRKQTIEIAIEVEKKTIV